MNAWLSRCYGLRRLSFCKGNRNLWALHISWEVKCENSTGIGKSPLKHVQHTLQAYFLGDHCKVVVFDCILSTGAVCGLCFAATRWMEKGWNGNPWPPKSSRSVNSFFFILTTLKKKDLWEDKKTTEWWCNSHIFEVENHHLDRQRPYFKWPRFNWGKSTSMISPFVR